MLQGVAVRIVPIWYVKMEESVIVLVVQNIVIAPAGTVACVVRGLIVTTTVWR
jgi:hypothetical protein